MTGVSVVQLVPVTIDPVENSTDVVKAFPSAITAGNWMVVLFSTEDNNPDNAGVVDDKANNWIEADSQYGPTAPHGSAIWYAKANAAAIAGAPTITIQKFGSVFAVGATLLELSTPSGTFLDVLAVANEVTNGGSTSTPMFVTLPKTTFNHSKVIAVYGGDSGTGPNVTPLTGYTSIDKSNNSSGHCHEVIALDTTATGVYMPGWTGTGTNEFLAITAIVVRGTNDGPTITTQPQTTAVTAGTIATFTVVATAQSGTLHYQWQVNGVNAGTDSATLSLLTSATDAPSSIQCLTSDSIGTIPSAVVTLYPLRAPVRMPRRPRRKSSTLDPSNIAYATSVTARGVVKEWNGSAWVSGKLPKAWNGSAWVQKPVKYWSAATGAWVTCT